MICMGFVANFLRGMREGYGKEAKPEPKPIDPSVYMAYYTNRKTHDLVKIPGSGRQGGRLEPSYKLVRKKRR